MLRQKDTMKQFLFLYAPNLKKLIFGDVSRKDVAECETAYQLEKKGYQLLMSDPKDLVLDVKKFDPFLLKTGRKNVFENEVWPGKPDGGWITPDNWYTRINDIVRTMIVVKYLDGVAVLVERLQQLCNSHELKPTLDWEARDEGYYAAHLYVEKEYSIPTLDFGSQKIPIKVEIQVTTQLQESIYKLTHKYYEERRKKMKETTSKWQWEYESDEFIPNYLGHILHYVEGMIMEVRNREMGK